MQLCEGDEFVIHLNLKALLMEENAFSRELKDVLQMSNHYLENFLQINNGINREEFNSETFDSRFLGGQCKATFVFYKYGTAWERMMKAEIYVLQKRAKP